MPEQARFEAVVLPQLDAAYNLARWLVRDPSMAHDVVQDAMAQPISVPENRAAWRWAVWAGSRTRYGLSFGAGLALAASLALVALPRQDAASEVVAGHIRALQPGHLMDVPSSDQHTVKPWFDGWLDYAPPVPDLAGAGFVLAGGRLDYMAGRTVAAVVYSRRHHAIDVFAWPSAGHPDISPATGSRNGYNYVRWSEGGLTVWVMSDLDARELADFARAWHDAVTPSVIPSSDQRH